MESSQDASVLTREQLAAHFRELTLLMYDTSVPIAQLEARVYPHLAPDIEFIDGILTASGARKFKVGLRGFHCVFYFDFDIFQLDVQLNENGDGGRVLVDGVMNLRTVPYYSYPLRTMLVYDFTLIDGGRNFLITRQEEIWSYGDLLENLPIVGRLFNATRAAAGYFFTGFFWLGATLRGDRAVASRRNDGGNVPARYRSWLHKSAS